MRHGAFAAHHSGAAWRIGIERFGPAAAWRIAAPAVDGFMFGAAARVASVAVYHTLHYHYGVPKVEASELLQRFVSSGVVGLEPESSLPVVAERGGAGLVGRLIHARHRARGAVTLTFERRQGQLEGAERLAAD